MTGSQGTGSLTPAETRDSGKLSGRGFSRAEWLLLIFAIGLVFLIPTAVKVFA